MWQIIQFLLCLPQLSFVKPVAKLGISIQIIAAINHITIIMILKIIICAVKQIINIYGVTVLIAIIKSPPHVQCTISAITVNHVFPNSPQPSYYFSQQYTRYSNVLIPVKTPAPLKLRPYGAIQICLLLLLLTRLIPRLLYVPFVILK